MSAILFCAKLYYIIRSGKIYKIFYGNILFLSQILCTYRKGCAQKVVVMGYGLKGYGLQVIGYGLCYAMFAGGCN